MDCGECEGEALRARGILPGSSFCPSNLAESRQLAIARTPGGVNMSHLFGACREISDEFNFNLRYLRDQYTLRFSNLDNGRGRWERSRSQMMTPRSTTERIVAIDRASSVPPHIQPPIAQVPRPTRDVVKLELPIVICSMTFAFRSSRLKCCVSFGVCRRQPRAVGRWPTSRALHRRERASSGIDLAANWPPAWVRADPPRRHARRTSRFHVVSIRNFSSAELSYHSCVINSAGFSLAGENCNERNCFFDCGLRLNILGS